MTNQGPYRSAPETVTVWERNEGNCIAWAMILTFSFLGVVFFFLPGCKPLGAFFLFVGLFPLFESVRDGCDLRPYRRVEKFR